MLSEPHISIEHNCIIIRSCQKVGVLTHMSKILGCSHIHDTHSGCAYVPKSTQMFHRKGILSVKIS